MGVGGGGVNNNILSDQYAKIKENKGMRWGGMPQATGLSNSVVANKSKPMT